MKLRIDKHMYLAAAIALLPGICSAQGLHQFGNWSDDADAKDVAKGSQEKSLSSRSIASRGTVTSGITMYGAFDTAAAGTIYILVRGNSLGSLGVTQNYLDLPTVTLYDSSGTILISSSGSCDGTGPVTSYYQNVRGVPAQPRDACIYNNNAQPGPITFTITPSAGSVRSGEVLFEVTLGP